MAPGWWCHVCDAHGLKAWHHDTNKKCPCGHTKCSRCRLESIGTPRPRAAPAQQQGHSLENPATHNGDGVFAVGDNGGAMLEQAGNWNGDGAFDSAVLFGGHQEVDWGLEGLGEMKMEEDGWFDF